MERVAEPWPDGARIVEGVLPASLERAAPRRAADFLAGRQCIASAIEAAGFPPSTVAIGVAGSPVWPNGLTGSVTHSGMLAIAAVAKTSEYASIGIDCEEIMSDEVAGQIAAIVLSDEDRANGFARESVRIDFATFISVVFSAKESIYKCLRPLAGKFFEFHDVHLVDFDLAGGELTARLAKELSPELPRGMEMVGRFMIDRDKVYTFTGLEPSWKAAP